MESPCFLVGFFNRNFLFSSDFDWLPMVEFSCPPWEEERLFSNELGLECVFWFCGVVEVLCLAGFKRVLVLTAGVLLFGVA